MNTTDQQVEHYAEPFSGSEPSLADDPIIVELRSQLSQARQGLHDAEKALKACEQSLVSRAE